MSFSLAALSELPMTHDPDPENPSIGWSGNLKPSTIERVQEMREQAQRDAQLPKCLIALGRIQDHLVGLAEDIRIEMEER